MRSSEEMRLLGIVLAVLVCAFLALGIAGLVLELSGWIVVLAFLLAACCGIGAIAALRTDDRW
ncbi:hypothetical protein [Arthrobacter monumenti]